MVAPKNQIIATADPKTYPLGEKSEHSRDGSGLALVALSHTSVEQRIYAAMLRALDEDNSEVNAFTARRLMVLAEIRSLSTIRRGLDGLVSKLSIEREEANGNGSREYGAAYRVFTPAEVFARRNELGLTSYTEAIEARGGNRSFERVINRVAENRNLSRREAQVALCCVEGLTNAEIGQRLEVTEQTVKFHLRHIFIKFGVKRRAELISRLLM